jgi:hypothetical protein
MDASAWPRHDTGNAVPESNLKSRVGYHRAVARRADNQARAMAAIAVGADAWEPLFKSRRDGKLLFPILSGFYPCSRND